MSQTAQTIIAIIAEQAMMDPADITADSTITSLGLDSLALVEVIFAIEEAFDIHIPFNANDPSDHGFDLSSIRAIIAGVEGLVAAKAA